MKKIILPTVGAKKAFTLMELMIVIVIIGILSTVGMVMFGGQSEKAKIAASKANHKSVVKYIAYEIMKCDLGEAKVMNGNLDCSKKGTYNWPDDVADATVLALNDFKNPYDPMIHTVSLVVALLPKRIINCRSQ